MRCDKNVMKIIYQTQRLHFILRLHNSAVWQSVIESQVVSLNNFYFTKTALIVFKLVR